MDKKILFKVLILSVGLLLVVFGTRFFGSIQFQKNVGEVFALDIRAYQWCSVERAQFRWTDSSVQAKFQTFPETNLAKRFCTLKIEGIQGIDLKTLSWKPLAESVDQQGEKVLLEWNQEHSIFKADGLPFRSSSLIRELLNK